MAETPTSKAPLIGQFSGPSQNSPRTSVPRKETPPPTEEDKAVAESLELTKEMADTPEPEEEAPKTPEQLAKEYDEGLSEVGLTLEQARQIMETILVDNFYQERVFIQSLPVVFRTRTYHDTVRLHRFMTSESPVYQASIQDIIARHNLASSLVKYGDKEFEFPDDEKKAEAAFDIRLKFVETRNALVVQRLMKLVYVFDQKMTKVFADGAPQDF